MPYLIDGHNLIAKMPDIDLSDENDENKLVSKLKGFVAGHGKRVIVVFDKGLPGGVDREKSTKKLEVVYASALGSTADDVIIGRIRRLKDAKNWTVVSSDNQVREVALEHKMKVMRSREFLALMNTKKHVKPDYDPSEAVHPRTDKAENEALLEAFLQKIEASRGEGGSSDLNKRRK